MAARLPVSRFLFHDESQPTAMAAKQVKGVFFIVGPTAVGKSEIAAEVAGAVGAEIVSADAFQIYRELELLTAAPDAALLARVPHHLIGAVSPTEEMNAEKFRVSAQEAIDAIRARGKQVIVVGGSGLYVQALTHGLSPLPSGSPALRAQLDQCTAHELFVRLQRLDPATAETVDRHNKRRLQ
ncbi:MAG TPA: isopentenyl transferase family protein, partial [Chthoniobacterales bacterium]